MIQVSIWSSNEKALTGENRTRKKIDSSVNFHIDCPGKEPGPPL
jgi:hypothetical protein